MPDIDHQDSSLADLSRLAEPRLRLICFPYAGGDVSAFSSWPAAMSDIGVYAARLPGRGSRLRTRPYVSAAMAARDIAHDVAALPSGPLVLYGHSMGAALAFETAVRLTREHGRDISALVVAARHSPTLGVIGESLHPLPEAEFLQKLEARYGYAIPARVRQEGELFAFLLRTLYADVTMSETYKWSAPAPLSCPLLALCGSEDTAVTPELMQDWSALTSATFRFTAIKGGHFFLNTHRPLLLEVLEGWLLTSASEAMHGSSTRGSSTGTP